MGKTYGALCIVYAIATVHVSLVVQNAFREGLTRSDALRTNLLRDDLERRAHLPLVRRALPWAHNRASLLSRLAAAFLFLVGTDMPTGEHVPERQREAFVATHRENVALDVTLDNGVRGLVDYERCLVVVPRVFVRLYDEPCRGVRHALYKTPLPFNDDPSLEAEGYVRGRGPCLPRSSYASRP